MAEAAGNTNSEPLVSIKQELNGIRLQFTATVIGSFVLTPLIGHAGGVTFGLTNREILDDALASGLLPMIMAVLLIAVTLHYWHYLKPTFDWLIEHPEVEGFPETLRRPLMRFSLNYWGFYLCYVLAVPLAYYWSTGLAVGTQSLAAFVELALLQLVVAILIGFPAYLFAMDALGRLVTYTGLPKVQFSLKSRLMVLGGMIPLLTHTVVLEYYWKHTGFIATETLILLALLGVIIIAITALSIRSMKQALGPVQKMLTAKGATSYTDLAMLRPHSSDEIGYMTQTLGNLFRRLDDQESNMHTIVDTAAEAIVVVNDDTRIKTVNRAAVKLFGHSSQDILGLPLSTLFPKIMQCEDIQAQFAGENEIEGLHRNGRRLTLSARFSKMQMSGKQMFTCMAADISERKAAERRLKNAEARYRDLVETAHDLVWSTDTDLHWTYLNNASDTIYGYKPAEMLQRPITDFSEPEHRERDIAAFSELLNGKEMIQYETVHIDRHGKAHNISFNARVYKDRSGNVIRINGTARDITKQKQFERQLTFQAQHDTLTGLYNRHYFHEELERLIPQVARSGAFAALFYIDLDQFKYINDTLGHASGDQLLLEVTTMLSSKVREGDILARFGGDEFTLLLYNVIEIENATRAAENIRKVIESYKFLDDGKSFNVTCSIGIVMIDNRTTSADDTLSHADLACNLAKARGRNRVHVYDPADQDRIGMAEDMGWAARVREVLEQDRFELAFQPIVSIIDGSVSDYEVLLRMPYDDGQTILPGGFMPAAERFGLIHNIDRWMVNRAIGHLSDVRNSGCDVRFAINLSGRAFEDPTLLPIIRKALDETGLNPELLTFEITETAAISNLAAAVTFIQSLKDIGCHFALDDFGSGFSSFTYLKHLPVDKLKIDGSFVKGLTKTPVDQAMVRSMNQVAHALGKQTIAESVEDAETLVLLRHFGVDYAQGHYIGRPRDQLLETNVVSL